MTIRAFYDPSTGTVTYVVADPETGDAVVIDPVLDFDAPAGNTRTDSVDDVHGFLVHEGLKLRAVLETHAHADHLSGSQVLKRRHGGVPVAIGARITVVQATFRPLFGLPETFPVDGSQFDRLLDDGEVYAAGSLKVRTIFTPGHTPACVTYHLGDALFSGDAIFMPDSGTGRCDFPGGSAVALHRSIRERIYALPDATRVFVGHDYGGGNTREPAWETTVGESKRENIHLRADTGEAEFVEMRTARDATLKAPRLLLPSIQVNIDAGMLPAAEQNGLRYLRLPLNVGRTGADADGIGYGR